MTIEEFRVTRNENLRKSNMERYGLGANIMRNIRICTSCGCPASADRNRCSCGGMLSEETLFQQYKKRHRFCRRCDTVVANDVKFCPECGYRI
jgi:hypothetical protein